MRFPRSIAVRMCGGTATNFKPSSKKGGIFFNFLIWIKIGELSPENKQHPRLAVAVIIFPP